ncbi:MFS transporter, partial [Staphylococcus aureus]|nr:MFS transporter [Staphylococcus aureus]
PIAVIIIIASIFLLKNVTETSHPKLDTPSVILSTLGFGGLLYSFSSVGEAGWSSVQFIAPLIVGIVSLIVFIRRQLKLKEPMLEFRVF